MRSLALISLVVAAVLQTPTADAQRSMPVLRLAGGSDEHLVRLATLVADSVAPARPLVLIGALAGGVLGGVLYARSVPDDGDFSAGLGIPLYVGGGVVIGSLLGYAVSLSIEHGRGPGGTWAIMFRRSAGP
jgi:hypothetical protein